MDAQTERDLEEFYPEDLDPGNIEPEDKAIPDKYRARIDEAACVAVNWTAVDEITSKEPQETPALAEKARIRKEQQIRSAVRVRQFVFWAEFIAVGCDELAHLKRRLIIMMRTVAPDLLSKYDLTPAAALKMEQRLLRALPVDFRHREYVPIKDALTALIDEDEIACALEKLLTAEAFRRVRFGEFCHQIAADAPDLTTFAKLTASMLRRVKAEYIKELGQSQADLGRKFDEQRATVSSREKVRIEQPLKKAGITGYHLGGGTRTETARENCRQAQMGNLNRRLGRKRRHANRASN